jgi:hypothetical protein
MGRRIGDIECILVLTHRTDGVRDEEEILDRGLCVGWAAWPLGVQPLVHTLSFLALQFPQPKRDFLCFLFNIFTGWAFASEQLPSPSRVGQLSLMTAWGDRVGMMLA